MRPGGHPFSQLLPEDKALPPPPLKYFEIECAKLHGGWPVWVTLSPVMRGELLAHEMHKNMRTHYEHDVLRGDKGGGEKRGDAAAPWSAVREKFFGGGRNVATN